MEFLEFEGRCVHSREAVPNYVTSLDTTIFGGTLFLRSVVFATAGFGFGGLETASWSFLGGRRVDQNIACARNNENPLSRTSAADHLLFRLHEPYTEHFSRSDGLVVCTVCSRTASLLTPHIQMVR